MGVILWKFSKKKGWVNTVRYCFSFIKHPNPFFHSARKANKYKYITLQCSLGGHCDCSTRLFSNHKCCCNGQWPLTSHYFKPWYVKNLPNESHLLDPIIFTNNANIFFNHKGIQSLHLFTVVNNKLVNIKGYLYYLFEEKLMFYFQDIQIFVFLWNPQVSKSVTSP